jgi:hypothetical protein
MRARVKEPDTHEIIAIEKALKSFGLKESAR